jgi:hypothetical protein
VNYGIIRNVSKTSDFCWATVPGYAKGVFLHCSQMQPPVKFTADLIGKVIQYDHIQPDHLLRPQIIGARFEAVPEVKPT